MRRLNAKQKAYLRRVRGNWDMDELSSMGDFETIYQEATNYLIQQEIERDRNKPMWLR